MEKEPLKIGQWVSYQDMANPYHEGVITRIIPKNNNNCFTISGKEIIPVTEDIEIIYSENWHKSVIPGNLIRTDGHAGHQLLNKQPLTPEETNEFIKEYDRQQPIIQEQKEKAFKKEAQKRQEEREKIKKDYPYLITKDKASKTSDHALGAKNIKTELQKVFTNIKFSTRSESYSGGNSINVSWIDGPTTEEIKKITNKYQEGYFDGMQDIYNYDKDNVWPDVFGGAKYVFENRDYSPSVFTVIVERVCKDWGLPIPEIKTTFSGSPWIEDYTRPPNSNFDLRNLVNQELFKTSFYTPPEPQTQNETPTNGNGNVTITHNTEHNGIEVRFPSKPDQETLDYLKNQGFRWSKFQKIWYTRFSESKLQEVTQRLIG